MREAIHARREAPGCEPLATGFRAGDFALALNAGARFEGRVFVVSMAGRNLSTMRKLRN